MIGRLKTKSAVPYGNTFTLNLPELGMKGSGTTFEMLMANLREFRRVNAIPIGLGFEDEVEQQICNRYPAECINVDPRIPNLQERLGYQDIVHGTEAFARLKLSGKPLVDQEEANRRASTCAVCPMNSDFLKPCGWLCGELKALADSVLHGRTTPYDDRLRSCRICRCFNGIAVHFPVDVQIHSLSDAQKAQFEYAQEQFNCWKHL